MVKKKKKKWIYHNEAVCQGNEERKGVEGWPWAADRHLSQSSSSIGQWEKTKIKSLWAEIKRGSLLTSYHHRQNRLHGLQGNTCSPEVSPWLHFSQYFPHFLLPYSVLPFLKYVFTHWPPALLMGSAVASGRTGWNHLDLAVSAMGQPLWPHCC